MQNRGDTIIAIILILCTQTLGEISILQVSDRMEASEVGYSQDMFILDKMSQTCKVSQELLLILLLQTEKAIQYNG